MFHCICLVWLSLIWFNYILIWGWRVWWLCSIEFDWVRLHQKLHSHNFFGSIAFHLRLEGMMIVFDWVWLGSTTSEIALTQFFWFNCVWFEAGGYDDCVRLSLIGFDYIRNCTHTIFLVQLHLIWDWRVWWLCSIEFDWVRLHQKLHSHNFFGSIAFDLRLEGMMMCLIGFNYIGNWTHKLFLVQLHLIIYQLNEPNHSIKFDE